MTEKKRLSHAKHNESTCDYLIKGKNFKDWVITTAFYSSLHYVDNEIFPFTENGVKYNTLSQYYTNVVKPQAHSNGLQISKHRAILDLVYDKLQVKVYMPYKWLYDNCMNARYNSYKVSELNSTEARNKLTLIVNQMTKL